MRKDLLAAAQANGGLVTRAQALELDKRHVLDDALNDGVLLRLHPGIYVAAQASLDLRLLRRAALAYLPQAALSHLDALQLWGVATPRQPTIHLTAPHDHRATSSPNITLHRRRGFRPGPPMVVERDGLRAVRFEQALVESWPLIPEVDRRAPIITALRERRTTAARLTATIGDSRLPGSAEMRRLAALVSDGCHSELEIWGHDRVFSDPRLPPSLRQHRVAVGGRTLFLDRYFPVECVDVELDGAAWHGRSEQRERDLRRDAALSAIGIQVVRYSHRRICAEPELVIQELRAILEHRRRLVAAG